MIWILFFVILCQRSELGYQQTLYITLLSPASQLGSMRTEAYHDSEIVEPLWFSNVIKRIKSIVTDVIRDEVPSSAQAELVGLIKNLPLCEKLGIKIQEKASRGSIKRILKNRRYHTEVLPLIIGRHDPLGGGVPLELDGLVKIFYGMDGRTAKNKERIRNGSFFDVLLSVIGCAVYTDFLYELSVEIKQNPKKENTYPQVELVSYDRRFPEIPTLV